MSTGQVPKSLRPAVLLDIDPAFGLQDKLRETVDQIVTLPQPPRLVCPDGVLSELETRLGHLSPSRLTFVGSGDYHYFSALFAGQIHRPATLLLLDYHDDASEEPRDMLTCGNWVRRAVRHPWVRRILYTDGNIARWADSAATDVLRWNSIFLDRAASETPDLLLPWIPTQTVYITIDKDVLRPSVAPTNWDQGILTLDGLMHILETIALHRTIFAMDVCGEHPLALPGFPTARELDAARKSEAVNLRLLAFWKQASSAGLIPHTA